MAKPKVDMYTGYLLCGNCAAYLEDESSCWACGEKVDKEYSEDLRARRLIES